MAAGTPHEGKSYADIVATPEVKSMVDGYVRQLNDNLNRWETIKKYTVLHRDLTIEDGEMTPSLKIKRRIVEANFSNEIESMYEGSLAHL